MARLLQATCFASNLMYCYARSAPPSNGNMEQPLPLQENLPRAGRKPTFYSAYLPYDGSYIDMPFDPTKSWRDYVLHPVQDQSDAHWERIERRWRQNQGRKHKVTEEENRDIVNDIAKNEALEHIDTFNAVYCSRDRSCYYKKGMDVNHVAWLHRHRKLPTLRYSQNSGIWEFLQPGEESEVHAYREAVENRQCSQSDLANSSHHTDIREYSPSGHLDEYSSDANNDEDQ